jgi:hypothetical protein
MGGDWRDMGRTLEGGDLSPVRREPTSGVQVSPHEVENTKYLTLPEFELRPLGRPARSQSLYRLRSPGSLVS